ncbi:MAG: PAS domain-containing protein, partial [Deltaproteobacteria bacterium]|nr:PAS domain-containing protein [Deltaproteobacteria bacterium]
IGDSNLKVGIVGGGKRCKTILQMFQRQTQPQRTASVVIVADENAKGPGYQHAQSLGIDTTTDFEALGDRKDLDFILDLAGRRDVLIAILVRKKSRVPVLDAVASNVFYDLLNIQKELINTRIFLDTVLDSIQEGILVINPEYEILRVNTPLLKKLKRPKEEVVGKYCYEVLYGEDRPTGPDEGMCPVAEVIRTHRPQHTKHKHIDSNGNTIYHSVSAYPVIENGKVSRIVEISRDITGEIKTQEMLFEQEKLSSVGKLAAGVAHEINNPLTAVLTNSMLLLEDLREDDPMYEDIKGITDETLRCREIVRGLLEFARQETPAKVESDLNKIVSSVVGLVRKQFSFKNITVEANLAEEVPLTRLDKDQLQQVIVNILMNSMESIERDGEIRLETSYDEKARHVLLRIKDTGRGIPEDIKLKLFDPFFTTKETGTGLGLSISHGIIQRHGGRISFESQAGKGTTFTIELPVG